MNGWSESASDGKPIGRARYRCVVRPSRYRYTRRRWHYLMHAVDCVGAVLFASLALVGRLTSFRRKPSEVQSILVVQLDHFGDAVLSSGLLRGLRQQYPQARIDVLASDSAASWYEFTGDVNRVWRMARTRVGRSGRLGWVVSLLAWGLRLRRGRYDLAIDIRGEIPNALLMWLAGARRRIGWAAGGGGFLLTDSGHWVYRRHESLARQELLTLALPAGQSTSIGRPRYKPSDEVRKQVRKRLDSVQHDTARTIVVHLGAGMPAKRWPIEHWRMLVQQLCRRLDAHVVLVGTGADSPAAAAVAGKGDSLCVSNWTGETDVAELVALCEQADLFLGADSGPAHVAAQCCIPTIALFSGTNRVDQWRPWGANVVVLKHATECSPCHREVCPLADHPCMRQLNPIEVLSAAARLLKTPLRGRAKRDGQSLSV